MSRSLLPDSPILGSSQLIDAPPRHLPAFGTLIILGADTSPDVVQALAAQAPQWQQSQWRHEKNKKPITEMSGEHGPIWFIECYKHHPSPNHTKEVGKSVLAVARDLIGQWIDRHDHYHLDHLHVDLSHASISEQRGALLGLELGYYRFRSTMDPKNSLLPPKLSIQGFDAERFVECANLAHGINIARHLVNLPAATLNPKSYATLIDELFSDLPYCQVDIWETGRLEQENMGLLIAVGQAAEHPSRMVHIRYRPPGCEKQKPIALIGKGITFDSGGLDIKPASGMQIMKKDMGGSAAVVGTMYWLAKSGIKQPCDAYLALAENAVGERSFRPGDIVQSRNGLTVEITNTDAEGRLVMADALDVAASQLDADEPELMIDVATLTGAIKVGLGTELAGMFANDDNLAQELSQAAFDSGDRIWRLPLLQEYEDSLGTAVADVVNSSSSRFGGAITAALFLQRFVYQKSWAHLDIYAWNDRSRGGCTESGGSGQGVQLLSEYFIKKAKG